MLELARSKEVLEREIGKDVVSISLPFSFPLSHPRWPLFEDRLKSALRDAGYLSCCTMQRGHLLANDDRFALKRMPVGRGDDLALFRAKLAGCYAWTQPAQLFYQKHLKVYPVTNYGSLA